MEDLPKLKAIETEYAGYKFRSRLEARHAVFLRHLDIPFEYEQEGFDLGDRLRYLPDLWLPEQEFWMEIKGQQPNSIEYEKARRLANLSDKPIYIMVGVFASIDSEEYFPTATLFLPGNTTEPARPNSFGHRWFECPTCNILGLTLWGWAELSHHGCVFGSGEHYEEIDYPRILAAYTAARQARFEHGRSGD